MFPGLVNCCTIDWFTEWPSDALQEVANRQMEQEKSMDDTVKESLCAVFATCHRSTSEKSAEMLATLKRKNYVTPTNYLEFVNGYRQLLGEKRAQLQGKAQKLRGGLLKLAETDVKVGELQVKAEGQKVVVAEAKVQCEELLVTIVAEKREADEQEKHVQGEKAGARHRGGVGGGGGMPAGLDKAMPALDAAVEALNCSKKDTDVLRTFSGPELVELCMKGVMMVLKKTQNWDTAKKELGKDLLGQLKNFDKSKLDDALLNKMKKYVNDPKYARGDGERVQRVRGDV